jgi:hypothetical protein
VVLAPRRGCRETHGFRLPRECIGGRPGLFSPADEEAFAGPDHMREVARLRDLMPRPSLAVMGAFDHRTWPDDDETARAVAMSARRVCRRSGAASGSAVVGPGPPMDTFFSL